MGIVSSKVGNGEGMAIDNRLLVVGAGGHAKVVIDAVRVAGWNPIAALDRLGRGHACCGVPVVGTEDQAQHLFADGLRNAVVAIGTNDIRAAIGARLLKIGFGCPAILHPASTISTHATIGTGTVVMAGAVINAAARIGDFVIVNTNATVEHDCVVGNAAHIAPRAVVGGDVQIGDGVLLGIGSVVKPQTIIGRGAIIGAGSVVVSAIPENVEAVGLPARPRRSLA